MPAFRQHAMMTTTVRNSLAFLMGFGVALLPSYGPFLGLLFFLGTRWTLHRSDWLWFAAALVIAVPGALHEGPMGFLFGLFQVLAPWLIYKAFKHLHLGRSAPFSANQLGIGLLSGFFVVVALSWLQIEELHFAYAKTIAQAIIWDTHPSLYGHTILTLGTLLAILLPGLRYRAASLGLAAFGILITGSREAAIAWVIVAVALLFVRLQRSQRAYLIEIGLVVVMLAIAAGLGPALGWGRVGFLVDILPTTSQNLIQGSEITPGDWWDAMGVEVEPFAVRVGEEELTGYRITKLETEDWLILH